MAGPSATRPESGRDVQRKKWGRDEMNRTTAEIDALFESQVATIAQPALVALIRSLRVPTRRERRPWDYGSPGEIYPCWIVLEHLASNTAIAYSDDGFGPGHPWGVLFITGSHFNMGMDCQWYETLEAAVRDSQPWDGGESSGSVAE